MIFLLKAAFWLGLVLVLLPSGGTKSATQVSAAEAVSAASAAVSDMSQFCSRQPAACDVGGQAAVAIGQRAQAGAKMIFDFLSERSGALSERNSTVDSGTTGSIASTSKTVPVATPPSQDTLRPADVAPAWRGPRNDQPA
jgi:hypothetical protein